MRGKYGFWRFMLDLFLIGITSGVWLLYLLIKALRASISR